MSRILEATKNDGTRKLLTAAFVDKLLVSPNVKVVSDLLAQEMLDNGFVRLESIVYGVNGQKRTIIIKLV